MIKYYNYIINGPDLAPCNFHIFGPLKHHFEGTRFEIDAEVMNEVETFYRKQRVPFLRDSIFKLEQRWDKCINCYGDYIEK